MAVVRDVGVVLRRLDYSETSQVLVVFCRELGQQRLIAKGVKRGTKKRFATGIDLLECGDVLFSARGERGGLATLTEWRQRETPVAARASLAAWYGLQYAAERTSQLTQEADPHPQLFDGLVALLRTIDPHNPLPALLDYLWLLLCEIGLQPAFDRCVACGAAPRDVDHYFSARQGGLICRDCEPAVVEKRRVERATLEVMRSLAALRPVSTERPPIGAWRLIDYHLVESSGQPSRVAAMLLKELQARRAD